MTRRSRRSSSAPRQVGSDEGLTSRRPVAVEPADPDPRARPEEAEPSDAPPGDDAAGSTRHTPKKIDQTTDDTDEGWGEHGDADAAARWLRENRPPHWD